MSGDALAAVRIVRVDADERYRDEHSKRHRGPAERMQHLTEWYSAVLSCCAVGRYPIAQKQTEVCAVWTCRMRGVRTQDRLSPQTVRWWFRRINAAAAVCASARMRGHRERRARLEGHFEERRGSQAAKDAPTRRSHRNNNARHSQPSVSKAAHVGSRRAIRAYHLAMHFGVQCAKPLQLT